MRHAQGIHNVEGEKDHNAYLSYDLFDAHLTPLGWNQVISVPTCPFNESDIVWGKTYRENYGTSQYFRAQILVARWLKETNSVVEKKFSFVPSFCFPFSSAFAIAFLWMKGFLLYYKIEYKKFFG